MNRTSRGTSKRAFPCSRHACEPSSYVYVAVKERVYACGAGRRVAWTGPGESGRSITFRGKGGQSESFRVRSSSLWEYGGNPANLGSAWSLLASCCCRGSKRQKKKQNPMQHPHTHMMHLSPTTMLMQGTRRRSLASGCSGLDLARSSSRRHLSPLKSSRCRYLRGAQPMQCTHSYIAIAIFTCLGTTVQPRATSSLARTTYVRSAGSEARLYRLVTCCAGACNCLSHL
jgi:hypothetical protein